MKPRFEYTTQLSICGKPRLPASLTFKLEKNWHDYFAIRIILPSIDNYERDRIMLRELDEDNRDFVLSFDTGIRIYNHYGFCGVCVMVLGFGVFLSRQWDY